MKPCAPRLRASPARINFVTRTSPRISWNSQPLRLLVAWLWIAALTLIVYRDAFTAPFFLDDISAITQIKSAGISAIFSASPPTSISGRPVVAFTLMLNHAVSGERVWSYHAFNLAVHLANVALLLSLLTRVFSHASAPTRLRPFAEILSIAVALVWSIHPLLSESLIYVIQRTELLATFFMLATIMCTARAFDAQKTSVQIIWLILAALASAMGMGCKETAIAIPFVVLVFDRLFLNGNWRDALRSRRTHSAGLFLTTFILVGFLLTSPRGRSVGFSHGIHWLDYLYTQANAIVMYCKLSVIPAPLQIMYDVPLIRTWSAAALSGLFILLAIAFTLHGLVKGRASAMAGAVFFLVLAPSSSFVPIVTEIVAERRMYLPLAALLALAAGACVCALSWIGERWPRLGLPANAIVSAGFAITAVFVYESHERTREFKSAEIIWRNIVAQAPGHPMGWNNLGTLLLAQDRPREAAACYWRAAQVRSANPELFQQFVLPRANLALALVAIGDIDRARSTAESVLKSHPAQPRAHLALARVFVQLNQPIAAVDEFRQAHLLEPENAAVLQEYREAVARLPAAR